MKCYHVMLYWGICKELIWSSFFIFIFLGGKTPDPSTLKNVRTYKDIMQEQDLHRDQVSHGLKINNILYAYTHLISTENNFMLIQKSGSHLIPAHETVVTCTPLFQMYLVCMMFTCFISRQKFFVISGTKQHQGTYRRFNLQQSQVCL